MCFGTLYLRFGDLLSQARPFEESKVDKIINFRRFAGDELDTPAAVRVSDDQMREVGERETQPVAEYEVLKL